MSSKKKKLDTMENEWYEGGKYTVSVGRGTEHQLLITIWHDHSEVACLVFWADKNGKVHFDLRNKGNKLVKE